MIMEIERILYRDEKYLLTKVSVIAYFDNSSMARDAVSLLYDTEKGLKFKDGTGTPNNSVKMAIFAKMVSTVTMILTMLLTMVSRWCPSSLSATWRWAARRCWSTGTWWTSTSTARAPSPGSTAGRSRRRDTTSQVSWGSASSAVCF